jgi:hypothetical protein
MKLTASLLLFSSSLLAPTAVAQNSDSEVTASWTEQGVCAYYYEKPGAWKSLAETCVKYCENNGGHGYSECDHTPYAGKDLPNGIDQSTIQQDDTGDVYVPCLCKCDNPDVEGIVTAIVDVVIEGLSHLDEIICGVFMTAMVSAVPFLGCGGLFVCTLLTSARYLLSKSASISSPEVRKLLQQPELSKASSRSPRMRSMSPTPWATGLARPAASRTRTGRTASLTCS